MLACFQPKNVLATRLQFVDQWKVLVDIDITIIIVMKNDQILNYQLGVESTTQGLRVLCVPVDHQ